MIEAYVLILLTACFAHLVNLWAVHAIVSDICPACGSADVQEVNSHIVCGNCGRILAGCCEGSPRS